MNTAILLIGGNLGNRPLLLQQAVQLIEQQAGKVVKLSGLYETAPWGNVQQPDYLNQALQISTPLAPLPLLHTLLNIEREIGRIRQQKWGARVIDIDIIFYNDDVISLPELKIPHPRMQNRQFVLVPLNEILPDWVHPVFQQTVHALLAACDDELPAKKLGS
ncbi:MAG TPA: 2-amino-4-hydroxy-6-hydroxymethyldihydropteridine diphosphokinase [Chitinophaga sp.]|uniref:2-amino-4-hydroxy-6- hydroxymethyldihydropteridine diphosphokinase n=1 Tax=Chitinophaga sp. TaxID=1869181 RepID=UPI002F9577A9